MDGMPVPEPLEHSVVGVPIEVGDSFVDVAGLNQIEHSGVSGPAYQLMMHLEVSGDWKTCQHDHTCDDSMPLDIRRTDKRPSPEEGEAIVTGWAEEVEIEFMIDTGCQVTILATSVFERMCAVDPQVRSQLCLCGRQLVLANSSPLTVKGELELTIVFP